MQNTTQNANATKAQQYAFDPKHDVVFMQQLAQKYNDATYMQFYNSKTGQQCIAHIKNKHCAKCSQNNICIVNNT